MRAAASSRSARGPGRDLHERVHLLHRQLPRRGHQPCARATVASPGPSRADRSEAAATFSSRGFARLVQREDAGAYGEVAPLGGQTPVRMGPQVREARRHVATRSWLCGARSLRRRGGTRGHPRKVPSGRAPSTREELPELVVQEGRSLHRRQVSSEVGWEARSDPAREVFQEWRGGQVRARALGQNDAVACQKATPPGCYGLEPLAVGGQPRRTCERRADAPGLRAVTAAAARPPGTVVVAGVIARPGRRAGTHTYTVSFGDRVPLPLTLAGRGARRHGLEQERRSSEAPSNTRSYRWRLPEARRLRAARRSARVTGAVIVLSPAREHTWPPGSPRKKASHQFSPSGGAHSAFPRPRVLHGDDAQQLPDARSRPRSPGKKRERQIRCMRVHVSRSLNACAHRFSFTVSHSREADHGLVERVSRVTREARPDAERARLHLAFAHRLAEEPRGQRIPASAVLTQGPVKAVSPLESKKFHREAIDTPRSDALRRVRSDGTRSFPFHP